MEDNKKVIDMENEAEVNEVDEIEETKLEKIEKSKPVQFVKKHGKKIAIGAVIGAAFLIGRALAAKDDESEEFDDNDNDDSNVIDIHDYTVSEEMTDNAEE